MLIVSIHAHNGLQAGGMGAHEAYAERAAMYLGAKCYLQARTDAQAAVSAALVLPQVSSLTSNH